jgi:uncharacterized protein
MRKFALLIIVFMLLPINLNAKEIKPSFDCKKAVTEVEKLICSDNELSKLDVHMNKAYNKFKATLDTEWQKKLKKKQTRWLKNRSEIYCMKDKMKDATEGTRYYNESSQSGMQSLGKTECLIRAYQTHIKNLDDWTNRTNYDFFVEKDALAGYCDVPLSKVVSIFDKKGEELYACFNRGVNMCFSKKPEEDIFFYVDRRYAVEVDPYDDGSIIDSYDPPKTFYQDEGVIKIYNSKNTTIENSFSDKRDGAFTDDFISKDVIDISKEYPSKEEYEKKANDILNSKIIKEYTDNVEFCKGIFEKVKGQSFRKWINEKFKTDDIKIVYPDYVAFSEQELKEKTKGQFKCDLEKLKKHIVDDEKNPNLRKSTRQYHYKFLPPYGLFNDGDNWLITGKKTHFIGTNSFVYSMDKNTCKIEGVNYLIRYDAFMKINADWFKIDDYASIEKIDKTNIKNISSEDRVHENRILNKEQCGFKIKN